MIDLPALAARIPSSDPADLSRWDEGYDPARRLTAQTVAGPGYGTRLPNGSKAHPTLTNFGYAVALLESGRPGAAERAADILAALAPLQERDPSHPWFGLWPWMAEEPLERMTAPDWNWADFCGARLVEILHFHGHRLSPGLRDTVRSMLENAAWSIFRRNCPPDYTNIALMGAAVTGGAGECLDNPALVRYGRARFAAFVRHTRRHGSFTEYNSPTYTRIAIEECERALRHCLDPDIRRDAEAVRRIGWQIVADHFHGPLFVWCGPCSRAYYDRMPEPAAHWFATRLQAPADDYRACPEALRPAFARLDGESCRRHVYTVNDDGSPRTTGTVWKAPGACFGSVDQGVYWNQQRPLLGYWATEGEPATALFRVEFLKDGRDFTAAAAATAQDHNRAVTALGFRVDRGDWHPTESRPKGAPAFTAKDWRWRFRVNAGGARAETAGDGFRLSAGDFRVDVLPAAECRFDGKPVRWEAGGEGDDAWVDAVVHYGDAVTFDLSRLAWRVAAALALVERDAPDAAGPVVMTEDGVSWAGLATPWPRKESPYLFE